MARRSGRDARRRAAHGRTRWGSGTRRRTDAPRHRAGRCRNRGARIPGGGRHHQPRRAVPLPRRHAAADRVRVRAAHGDARGRSARRADGQDGPSDRRCRVLPGARDVREHRVRGRAVRRAGRARGQRPAGVRHLAARAGLRPGRCSLAAGGGGRTDRDGARGRRHPAGRRLGGRGRRGVGRQRARRARRARAAGPVPDVVPCAVGGQRRGAVTDGRGHAGRDPRVRRPDHHGAVLVQGVRAGRGARLRGRHRTRHPPCRDRRPAGPAAARPERREEDRAGAVVVPDQARPGRQRRGPGHPSLRRPAAGRAACGRLRPGGGRPGQLGRPTQSGRRGRRGRTAREAAGPHRRGHAHPHAHRRRRARRRMADRTAARGRAGTGAGAGVPALVRRAAAIPARGDGPALG